MKEKLNLAIDALQHLQELEEIGVNTTKSQEDVWEKIDEIISQSQGKECQPITRERMSAS